MATLREIVYMCNDMLKSASDDAYFNEEHIRWLIGKFRSLILKRIYMTERLYVPENNYQTLCLELIKVDAIPELPCEGGHYVRSKEPIPPFLHIGHKKVYAVDYFQGFIEYVAMERFRWAGHDRWRRNIIYATIAPDHYMYFRSQNPQYLYLKNAKFTAIFDDPEAAQKLSCDTDELCDTLDMEYPLEDSLVQQVVEMVVQEILKPTYTPENSFNNSADDQGKLNNTEQNGTQAQQEAAAQQAAAQAAAEQQQGEYQ